MQPDGRDLFFVYGTLLTSVDHPLGKQMRAGARLLGEGSIRARLYIVNDPDDASNYYPAAVPAAADADRVHGEVYEIDGAARLYAALDGFEACSSDWPEPHEFLRRRIRVRLASGGEVTASCYLYTWDVSRAEWIPHGRFAAVDMAQLKSFSRSH